MLLVTNYSNNPGIIQIEQTNAGQEGAGSTIAEIEVDLGNDIAFCGLPEYQLTADAPFGDYFEWYLDGEFINSSEENTLTVAESGEYSVIVFDEQCGSSAQDFIQVDLLTESYANEVEDIITCDDSSGDGIENFDLSIQTESILGGQDPNEFIVSFYDSEENAQSANNILEYNYVNFINPQPIFARVEHIDSVGSNLGCYSITEFNIVVQGSVPEVISPYEYVLCEPTYFDNTQIFDLDSQIEVILDNQNIENYDVSYHLSEEDAFNAINPLTSNYENISNPQTIYVRVEDKSAFECFSLTNLDLVVCQIPQGISPNGDGFNDTFELKGYDVKRIKIYNRYGKLVYETSNYSDNWDGQSNEGNKLPVGTYFYHILYNEGLEKTGWLYINY